MDFAHYWFGGAGGGPNPGLIGNSLRFRGSNGGNGAGAHLYRNNTSNGDRQVATFSYWWKHCNVQTSGDAIYPFVTNSTSTAGGFVGLHGGAYSLGIYDSSYSYYDTQNQFRDPSAWYHIVYIFDTNNANADDRVRIYSNGVRQFRGAPGQYTGTIPQGRSYNFGSTVDFWINRSFNSSAQGYSRYDGYMAEYHYVNGTIHEPTVFGTFSQNGVWMPIEGDAIRTFILANGGYGGPGHYLDFSDPANIGADRSGNGNNFTPNNFQLSDPTATSYDWMADSPTNNFATANRIDTPNIVYKDANLLTSADGSNVTSYNNGAPVTTLRGGDTGRYYAEVTVEGTGEICVHVAFKDPTTQRMRPYVYYYRNGQISLDQQGVVLNAGSFSGGSVIGVMLDMTNRQVTFYSNSGSAAGPIDISGINSFDQPSIAFQQGSSSGGCSAWLNYGQRPYRWGLPQGAAPLSSAGLPEATITNPSDHFHVETYQGNTTGGRQIITGFRPGLVWTKGRLTGADHAWMDSLRGTGQWISSNRVDPFVNQNDAITAFNDDGYTLGADNSGGPSGNFNLSPRQYMTYSWRADETFTPAVAGGNATGVSGVRDVAGGFSILRFNFTESNTNYRINHGLSQPPDWVMMKNISRNTNWFVQTRASTNAGVLFLNSNGTGDSGSLVFQQSFPDANNVFFNTNSTDVMGDCICYCWHAVPGYSFFGRMQGNGIRNGPFVEMGLSPAFVMYKSVNAATNWGMRSPVQSPFNPSTSYLYAQSTTGDTTALEMDLLSNGLKWREDGGQSNSSGQEVIYFAFAAHPFGGANVSPAPAR